MFRGSLLFLSIIACYCGASLGAEELINLQEGQRFQEKFDERYFEINSGFEKIRHILLHLVKSTGKVATYCEATEHGKEVDPLQVIDEVLPDLLIHALQIANYYEVDLGKKYEERIQFIIDRAASNQKESR
jgi:NTP pyrophosphatase (non-canonical NTP hydrolase)